jgi:hypothetical protein
MRFFSMPRRFHLILSLSKDARHSGRPRKCDSPPPQGGREILLSCKKLLVLRVDNNAPYLAALELVA